MRHGRSMIINGEIILAGAVLSDTWAGYMWEDDVFFCPRMLREALVELGDGPVTVRMSSYGGHVEAGEAMRAILAAHPGEVTLVIEGVAMSAATMLAAGADRRLMTEGSLFMIHDPSGGAFGTQYDLRREADVLEKYTQIAAQIYALSSGQTVEAMRAAMQAETFYTAQEALEAGFIHAIAGADDEEAPEALPESWRNMMAPPQSPARALVEHRSIAMMVAQRARHQQHTPQDRPAGVPAAQRGAPAPTATTQEAIMPQNAPAEPTANTPPVAAAPTPPAVDTNAVIAAERQRSVDIQNAAQPFIASGQIDQEQVTQMIANGLSTEAASAQMLTMLANAQPPATRSAARVTRDEGETRMEGMIGALMGVTEGPAADYRGMRLRRLAIELSGSRSGFNDIDAIRAGMTARSMVGGAHGVSDFAYITTEVMNRMLMQEYQRRAPTWPAVCGTPVSAADFREIHAVRFGGDFQLKPVLENGEYESATLSDEAEGLRVERRGRTINLTFEAVVNDDMGAFTRIPGQFAMAARTMENQIVWALIRKNAVLKSDGQPLFAAERNNTAAAAGISVASVGGVRRRMWEQRAFGSTDADDFLEINPDLLIVPPALEGTAMQFTKETTPARDDDANPYKTTLSTIVVPNLGAAAGGHDNRWYVVSSDLPPISFAYLQGYEAPTVVTIEGMNPDVVTMNARHICGAAATEPRGIQRVGQ